LFLLDNEDVLPEAVIEHLGGSVIGRWLLNRGEISVR